MHLGREVWARGGCHASAEREEIIERRTREHVPICRMVENDHHSAALLQANTGAARVCFKCRATASQQEVWRRRAASHIPMSLRCSRHSAVSPIDARMCHSCESRGTRGLLFFAPRGAVMITHSLIGILVGELQDSSKQFQARSRIRA